MPDATPTELVFHAGKPEQQPRGWACVFEVRRGDRVTGRVTTAPLWDSEAEAVAVPDARHGAPQAARPVAKLL